MPYRKLALVIALSVAGLAHPAFADLPENRWTATASVVGLSPGGDDARANLPGGAGQLGISSGSGFGLALDYRFSERWEVGLSMRSTSLDSRFRLAAPGGDLEAVDAMRFELFGLQGNYRFFLHKRFDLYLEGAVVMSKGADQIFTTGPDDRVKLTFDDDFGYEVSLGTDVRLTSSDRWILRGGLGYLVTILETDSGFEDVNLDPWTLRIGIGYRF